MEKKVIIITGPTASGKTDYAIELAKYFDSAVISADSRQIFRHLNIGTAKPSRTQLSSVKHYLIDILEPDEEYNASMFEVQAMQIIESLQNSGKIPVVAGGTGLYIKALIEGIFDGPSKDIAFREEMHGIMEREGTGKLLEMLKEKDPVSASKMNTGNWKRIVRALEVLELTGEPIWAHHNKQTGKTDTQFFQFAIDLPRENLYKRIEERVDQMISSGLETETRKVLDLGYSRNLNSLNTVGYKEMISYICNEISCDRCIELIKRNSRRYAKRQVTWFRADPKIKWISAESLPSPTQLLELIHH